MARMTTDEINATISAAKDEYNAAKAKGDQAGMDAAHQKAEDARESAGYSGGIDGSQNIATPKTSSEGYAATRESMKAAQQAREAAIASGNVDAINAADKSISDVNTAYVNGTPMPDVNTTPNGDTTPGKEWYSGDKYPSDNNDIAPTLTAPQPQTQEQAKVAIQQVINDISTTTAPGSVERDASDKLIDSILQKAQGPDVDYKQMYDDIIAKLPTVTPTKGMTWEEAMAKAKAELEPQFDERLAAANKAVDYSNIKTGFFGQLPGEVIKRETQLSEDRARNSAIAGQANSLIAQNAEDARSQDALNNDIRNSNIGIIQNALANATQQNRDKTLDLFNVIGINENRANRAEDVDFRERQFASDEDFRNRQLSLEEQKFSQAKYEFDQTFNEQKREWQDKFDYDKEIGDRSISLDEAKHKLDEKVQLGQLTIEQENLILDKKKLDLAAQDQGFQQNLATKKLTFDEWATNEDLKLKTQAQKDDRNIAQQQVDIAKQNANTNSAELDWAQNPNNPDNIYKSAQASNTSNSQQQTVIDNTAVAEAMGQKDKGTLKEWFAKNKADLAKDISTTAYNRIIALVNGEDKNTSLDW